MTAQISEPPEGEPTRPETPPPASSCRRLLRRATTATLATAERSAGGWPYASLVQVATAHDASPLLLLSDLADHTQNFKQDDRVSLMLDDTRALANPLTGARVTLQGRIEKLGETAADARLEARYLARHPEAEDYAAFGDFNFYRIVPEWLHLVAGFGRIHWLAAPEVFLGPGDTGTLAEEEAGILDHMNADHADAIDLYAAAARPGAPAGWRMTAIDPEGLDIMRAEERCRLDFANRVTDGASARQELVRLVKEIRARKGLATRG